MTATVMFPGGSPIESGRLRVLILEDVPADAELTIRALKQGGLTASFAVVDNEAAFVDQLRESPPDVILSDYKLPGFNGRRALEIALSSTPLVPFIFVTGALGEDAAVELVKEGAWDYVTKERPARLAVAVQRALDEAVERREHDELRRREQETIVALRNNEELFRTIADFAPIGIMESLGLREITYANKSSAEIAGRDVNALVGSSWVDALHLGDGSELVTLLERSRSTPKKLSTVFPIQRPDGAARHVRMSSAPLGPGSEDRWVTTLEDVTEEVKTREALAHQAFYDDLTGLPNRALFLDRLNQELVHYRRGGLEIAVLFMDLDHFKSVNDSLGHEIGDAVLKEVGARFGGAVRAGETAARFGGDEFVFIIGGIHEAQDSVTAANRFLTLLEPPVSLTGQDLTMSASVGVVLPRPHDDASTILRDADTAMYRAKESGRNCVALFNEEHRSVQVRRASSVVEREPGEGVGVMPVARDRRLEDGVRDLVEGFLVHEPLGGFRSFRTLVLLAQSIDLIDYSVLILDLNFHIVYANATAARTSGYALSELVDAHPRILGNGWRSQDFYDESEKVLQSGLPWRGVFINRRKSGETYQEDATISPICDAQGSTIAYVEIKKDLTVVSHVERDLMQVRSDHEAIAQLMREVSTNGSLRDIAQSFCDAVVRLANVDVAVVLHTLSGTKMRTIAVSGTTLFDGARTEPYDALVASSVLEQVANGPVRILLTPGEWPGDEELRQHLLEDGVAWVVVVPIVFDGKMIATLNLASRDPATEMSVDSRLPLFEEMGLYAGALFGSRIITFEEEAELHAVVKGIIDQGSFRTVFQPIVDMGTHETVGYEALTRFDDGVAPAQRFADATIVGLGTDLVCATAAAALRVADSLPEEAFLTLNFSAPAILNGSAARVVGGARRPIVIEITEHELAGDYAAVKEAIMGIPGCRFAIDDMGAGHTSLIQVVELAPQFVKLDISLVCGVDTSPKRQALVEGICHFAAMSGVVIIAEGVETVAEAAMLRSLGSSLQSGSFLAQGNFFGPPQ